MSPPHASRETGATCGEKADGVETPRGDRRRLGRILAVIPAVLLMWVAPAVAVTPQTLATRTDRWLEHTLHTDIPDKPLVRERQRP